MQNSNYDYEIQSCKNQQAWTACFRSCPRPSHYRRRAWLLPWRSSSEILRFTPDVTGQRPSEKVLACLIGPRHIFPKVLGVMGKCETLTSTEACRALDVVLGASVTSNFGLLTDPGKVPLFHVSSRGFPKPSKWFVNRSQTDRCQWFCILSV